MPEPAQRRRRTDLAIALTTGVGVFLLYALLVLAIVIESQLTSQQERLDAVFTESINIVQEARTAINA